MSPDIKDWIGREVAAEDVIAPDRARALWASLEDGMAEPGPGTALPPLWHWMYFWVAAPRSELGSDGHASLGGFLPDLGPVRRMWAGSRVTFHAPLRLGETASRLTTIADITVKEGRSGSLTFLTLRHEISGPDGLAITDEQDLVYREMPPPEAAGETVAPGEPAPSQADRTEHWTGDPVLLFRYSALTFNSHRIHYDEPYATGEEGYRGLIVHGPLMATLMAGAATRLAGGPALAAFSFRATSPVFANEPFSVHAARDGDGARLWIRNRDGAYATKGTARW